MLLERLFKVITEQTRDILLLEDYPRLELNRLEGVILLLERLSKVLTEQTIGRYIALIIFLYICLMFTSGIYIMAISPFEEKIKTGKNLENREEFRGKNWGKSKKGSREEKGKKRKKEEKYP